MQSPLLGMRGQAMIVADDMVDAAPPRLGRAALLAALARFRDACRTAPAGTVEERFVIENIEHLAGIGLLAAPWPVAHGGLGWGTEPHAAAAI